MAQATCCVMLEMLIKQINSCCAILIALSSFAVTSEKLDLELKRAIHGRLQTGRQNANDNLPKKNDFVVILQRKSRTRENTGPRVGCPHTRADFALVYFCRYAVPCMRFQQRIHKKVIFFSWLMKVRRAFFCSHMEFPPGVLGHSLATSLPPPTLAGKHQQRKKMLPKTFLPHHISYVEILFQNGFPSAKDVEVKWPAL